MRLFYGVYLRSTAISTILDIVRFLGEPDSIRFAHITLRGPYSSGLNRFQLQLLNDPYQDRLVELVRPVNFFSNKQSTVAVAVNLHAMNSLLYKPDFPDGVPHLTLYDGGDRDFGKAIFELLCKYSWNFSLEVGPLQKITSRKDVNQEFLPFFNNFCLFFRKLVDDPKHIANVKELPDFERLKIIHSILERCTESELAPNNEAPSDILYPRVVRCLTSVA